MMTHPSGARRRGSTLPLLAVSLVALCGFVALSVDVGMMAVAKTQAQNAADLAALSGARTLEGSPSSNIAAATSNAQAAVTGNNVLSVPMTTSNVAVQHGSLHYDPTSQAFYPQYPPAPPDNYNLTQATVTVSPSTSFARIWGQAAFSPITATAVAAHRPRDVTIVLDFSGSMNNESDLWNCETYLGSMINTPNNADPIFPKWGHYSAVSSANLQCTSSDSRVGMCNVTAPAQGLPAMAGDYYQNNRGSSPVAAFTAAPSSYATTAAGDHFLNKNGDQTGQALAVTVNDIVNGNSTYKSNFESQGYAYFYNLQSSSPSTGEAFAGYMQGPGYWGKTFFIWPPDPRTDWRTKFFFKAGGSYPSWGGAPANTDLYDANGNLKAPPGNYVINYKNILAWIKSSPNPFPAQLRAGRILYYSQIPTDVPSSAYTHTNPNSQITNPDQRFWKEYIDYTLGVWRDPTGVIHRPASSTSSPVNNPDPTCCIAPDFQWGNILITAKPSGQYMGYDDNPLRPGHRFWFGPMTMIQYLSDTGLFPGTASDISMAPAKLGIASALQDIQNNHPNDLVSLILYSRPQYSSDPAGTGAFNRAAFNLGQDYQGMINALYFPPNSATGDVRPWDANGLQTPRAHGDYDSNRATSYSLMLAYNQFSGSSVLSGLSDGGLGRKGAQRLVILETDGMANLDSIPSAGFWNGGPNNSYYNILPGQTVFPVGYNSSDFTCQIVQAICNKSDGTPVTSPGYVPYTTNPGYPGFSSTNKPVTIQTIVFGAMFEPTAAGATQDAAVSLMQQISGIGGTVFPSSASDPTNGYKWCIGTLSQRQAKLEQAFTNIMNDGVAVSLVK
jgi:Flp pilus assembly protein TadG